MKIHQMVNFILMHYLLTIDQVSDKESEIGNEKSVIQSSNHQIIQSRGRLIKKPIKQYNEENKSIFCTCHN